MSEALADKIDAVLPQTQCRQCGYPGCRPYAEAVAAGRAGINQCPPGGEPTIRALAGILGREPLPLNTAHGETKPRALAVIDEALCIGCFKCVQACPVDAIVGAPKLMHTVLADECTGCELCLPPCPVDCIRMLPVETQASGWSLAAAGAEQKQKAERARSRYRAREERLRRLESERRAALEQWRGRLHGAR